MNVRILKQDAYGLPFGKVLRPLLVWAAVAACSLPLHTAATTLFRNDMDRPVIGAWSLNGEGSMTIGSGVNTGGNGQPRTHFLNSGNWLRVTGGTATNVPTATGELTSPGALDGTVRVSLDVHAFTSGTAGRLYEVAGFDGTTKLFSLEMDMQHNLYINGVQAVEPNDAFWGLNWTYLEVTLNASDFDLAVTAYSPENGTPGSPDGNGPIVTVTNGPAFPTGTSDLYTAQPYLAPGIQLTKIVVNGNSQGVSFVPLEFFDNLRVRIEGDSDVDGLPDWWEIEEFTNITAYTGADDPDYDGLDNVKEMTLGTNPLDPDTDSDGLLDGAETGTGNYVDPTDTGTYSRGPDADADGVIDGAEVDVYGSDPFVPDADNDTAPDVVELTMGTDPNDLFDDPFFIYNMLAADMPEGDDWNEGAYFSFGGAAFDDVYAVGGSSSWQNYGELIRSPEGVGTDYPGNAGGYALILSGEGPILRLKQDDGETVTINDLRLRGGQVDNGNEGDTLVLAGAITVEQSTLTNVAEVVVTAGSTNKTYSAAGGASILDTLTSTRGLTIDASIAGDQGLSVRGAGQVEIRSLDNTFSGGWTVLEGTLLKARGLNALGDGDIYLENGTLDSDYNLAILDDTLTVSDPNDGLGTGILIVDKEHYVGALEAGSTSIGAGTYTASGLVAAAGSVFSNSFVDGGGTVTIGAADTDADGIPDPWEIANFGDTSVDPGDDTHDSDGLPMGHEFAAGSDPKNSDSDGDTLGDGAEVNTHGTDPTNTDTDGDTLGDGDEVAGAGSRPPTDPLDTDTDGDGLTDDVETNSGTFVDTNDTGTDPTDTDTDGDGFDDGVEVLEGTDPTDINDAPSILFRNDFDSPVIGTWTNSVAGSFTTGSGAATGGGNQPRNHDLNNGNWLRVAGGSGVATVLGTGDLDTPGDLDGGTVVSFDHHAFTSGTAGRIYAVQGLDGASNQLFDVGFDMQQNIYINGVQMVEPNNAFDGLQWTKVTVTLWPATYDVLVQQYEPPGPGASGSIVVVTNAPSTPTGKSDLYTGNSYLTVGTDLSTVVVNGNANSVGSEPLEFFDNLVARTVIVVDDDTDGLPDSWEIKKYGDISLYDGDNDPDGDLLDNAGEYSRGTDPLDQDTDDDGLTDKVETNTGTYVSSSDTGTHPLFADTDGDTLTDGAEVNTHGTDPHDPDTDGDGFSDTAEIAAGSDPVIALSIPEWCSNAFGLGYEAIADVPSVENAADGWTERDNAAPGAGVVWSNGYLLIDTYDTNVTPDYGGGAWPQNDPDEGGAWDGNNPGSFSVEVKARVLADGGDFGLNIWVARAGNGGRALASITTNAVYWGDKTTVLTDGIDNTTSFHVYRVLYDAWLDAYSVYRDGVLLANGLPHAGGSDDRLIVGDTGSSGMVKAEVDYIRAETGLPWGADGPTDDCDGDGLLNNEEDINGNGSQDPGETDQGDPDSDGDGHSDGDEVLVTGTDPLDANSVFEVVDATLLPGGTLEWSSVPGKTYRVQYSDAMDPTNWTDLVPDQPASSAGTTSYTDPAAAGIERYYRVIVLFP